MDKERKITNCYVFGNGMVMTFDQCGQQMPEYQGRYEGSPRQDSGGVRWPDRGHVVA